MNRQKLNAKTKEAEKLEPRIKGWDMDIQGGMLWAEYEAGKELGSIRGIRLLTGKIVLMGNPYGHFPPTGEERKEEAKKWAEFISSGDPDFSKLGLKNHPNAPDCSRREVWEEMWKAWQAEKSVCSAEQFYIENETNIIGQIRDNTPDYNQN